MSTLVIVIIVLALVFDYINGFHDAANYNIDTVTRRIFRGTDCNDADPAANPIRPENCVTGSRPEERDALLRRQLRW